MITPILLGGGSGTRLWPVSRRSYPKQFAPLFEGLSLFQATAHRFDAPGFAAPVVVTAEPFRFVAQMQLQACDIPPAALVVEPAPRNTAAAALAGALILAPETLPKGAAPITWAAPGQATIWEAPVQDVTMQDVTRQDAALQNMGAGFAEAPVGRFPFLPPGTAPSANGCGADPLLLLTPCDHAIPDPEGFRAAVLRAVPAARAGRIVTFGIRPDGPETGYGWLDLGDPRGGTGLRDLRGFVEKPSAEHAARMLEAGNSLWNAGVFLARLSTLRAAFRTHAPRVAATVEAAMADARPDMAFLRPDAAAWDHVPDISIDHAVMEKAGNLSVAPYDDAWSDLGSWEAIWQEMPQDNAGNALQGAATAIDCSDTLLRSEAEGIRVVGIGLEDMIAVAMPDAVLVAPRARSQEVGRAVTALRAHGARQADAFPRDHRPWGWFETLALGDRFQVKRLHVAPGAALSLQSHVHRAEHWVVVQGTARVTLDDDIRLLGENQSIYIPLGARHRLENPGLIPMILIEVQTGSYLQEDDITRYEDIYARS